MDYTIGMYYVFTKFLINGGNCYADFYTIIDGSTDVCIQACID